MLVRRAGANKKGRGRGRAALRAMERAWKAAHPSSRRVRLQVPCYGTNKMIQLLDPGDRRGMWQLVGPDTGLTLRQAMLCYDGENLAERFLDLEAQGFAGDPPMLYDVDGWPTPREVLSLFRVRARQLSEARSRLEYCLTANLATGALTSTGYSAGDPLDEPARTIAPDRWRMLTPDFETSHATGAGVLVTGILVFQVRTNRTTEAAPTRFSPAKARVWYQQWVKENTTAGTQPSRQADLDAARKALGGGIPRDVIRDLRRELAPEAWKSSGRRKNGS